jgi:hypothetical protein
MSKRALLLAAGIGMSFTVSAQAERPDYRADGTVRVGRQVFSTLAAYYASPTFQQSGARCGTNHAPVIDAFVVSTSDCSLSSTTINPEYDDNRPFVIQVVFHIIKKADGTGDIPPALIHSQIDVLNEDFNAQAGTPGGPGTNTKILFVLAKFAPNGQPTTGIEVITNDAYFTDPGDMLPNPMKAALRWDPTRYLNIYTNDAAGNLGYAKFPQQHAGAIEDGVVLRWLVVGRPSLGAPPYNLGRTATHEVGHYLGLFHTFHEQCGLDVLPYESGDRIADTNPEEAENRGCTPSASTCLGGGMIPIENYMNYSDDSCMDRFTPEQTNRMRCALINYRLVNTAPRAQFTHTATDKDVTFTNTSTDSESPLAMLRSEWTFGDGMTSTVASPTHTYAADGTYQVTLEIVDPGSGTSTVTQQIIVVTTPSTPDGPNPGGDDDGGGCCQAPGGGTTFLLCALPVVLVLRRRRRT